MNLAYEMLKWKVHIALVKAKLEPFLGFVHSTQYSKPSLVCDFQELYRCLIDDFLVQHCQDLKVKDFGFKTERVTEKRVVSRQYLEKPKTAELTRELHEFFDTMISMPRVKHGEKQTLNTLIREEAMLFAEYLNSKKETWKPRTV